MKRTLVVVIALILTLSLLSACGGNSDNSGGNSGAENSVGNTIPPTSNNVDNSSDTNAPANQGARLINASELISREDAERILGGDVTIDEKKNDLIEDGAVSITYDSNNGGLMYYLTITLCQDAALDENRELDRVAFAIGGTASLNESTQIWYEEKEGNLLIDDLGDWACIKRLNVLSSSDWQMIQICYGDYQINVASVGWPKGSVSTDEEKITWKKETLTEVGKLAFERLEAILK